MRFQECGRKLRGFVVAAMVSAVACSSAPPVAPRQRFFDLLPHPIMVRRPPGEIIVSGSGPGGVDFKRESPPDRQFDCKKIENLYKQIDLKSVLSCLGSLSADAVRLPEPRVITYELRRSNEPEFILEFDKEDPETMSCLNSVLPGFPVPREIFFRQLVDERMSCFSSRIEVEGDDEWGLSWLWRPYKLVIEFPLVEMPTGTDGVVRQLMSWSLTPFIDFDAQGEIRATPVPDHFCKICFGSEKATETPPNELPHWP